MHQQQLWVWTVASLQKRRDGVLASKRGSKDDAMLSLYTPIG